MGSAEMESELATMDSAPGLAGSISPRRLPDHEAPSRIALDSPILGGHELGPLRIVHLSGHARAFARPAHAAPGPVTPAFCFLLQGRGRTRCDLDGARMTLMPGDLALCDLGAPYALAAAGDAEMILLHVPGAVLRDHLPFPGKCSGRHLARAHDLVSTAGAVARRLVDQLRHGLDREDRDQAARHLLALTSGCFAAAPEQAGRGSVAMAERYWRARRFIDRNLRDPALAPTMIAARLGLSPRYLRMIFAAHDETLPAHILRRRLEACAARLRDARWAGHSITEIAFSWGFNSAAHFTRSFRHQFGQSPRDYRQCGPGRRADTGGDER